MGVSDRLRAFAGTDPGSWSLVAGGVAGITGLVAGALALAVAGGLPSVRTVLPWTRLLVGATATTAGVAVACWYLLVEREGTPTGRRAVACGALAGAAGLPAGWSLTFLWSSYRTTEGLEQGALAAVGSRLSLDVPALVLAGTVAVPLAGLGLLALARVRRESSEATDAAVRERVAR